MSDLLKDPVDKDSVEVNWAPRLADAETISTVTWTVPTGITQSSSPAATNTDTTATIWIEGGTATEEYSIGCRITTNQSRIIKRSFTVQVENR